MRRRRWGVVLVASVFTLASFSVAHAEEGGGPGPSVPPVPTPTPSSTPTVPPVPTPTPKPTKPPKPPKPEPSKPPKPEPSKPPKPEPTKPPKPGPTEDDDADQGASPDKTKQDKKPPKPTPPPPPPVPQAHTPAEGPDFPVWGVDVSKWQHPEAPLDWPALSASHNGFMFTFVKASEGAGSQGVANDWYTEDVAGAKAAGAYVGAYHYAGPGLPVTKDALAEARHAVKAAGTPGVGDLPLVLDMESNPDALSPTQMSAWALTWLEEVERLTGRKPIFYTYPAFFATDVHPDPALGEYPLWIANYGLAVQAPSVPEPWTAWTFWQHSAEGELPGTHGFIDLNVYAGSKAELALLSGVTYQGEGVDASGVSLLGDAMLSALTVETEQEPAAASAS